MELNQSYLSLQILDQSLTVIEFTNGDGAFVLKSWNSLLLPVGTVINGEIKSPAILAQNLKKLFAEAKPSPVTASEVLLTVNNDLIFQHCFRYPAPLSEEEIAAMIPRDAEKIIPFNQEETYWDFKIQRCESGGEEQNKLRKAQFSSIPMAVARQYISLLADLGLSIINLAGSGEVYKTALLSKLPACRSFVLLIEVDYDCTRFFLYEHNIIVYSKTLRQSLKHFAQNLKKNSDLDEAKIIGLLTSQNTEALSGKMLNQFLEDFAATVADIVKKLPLEGGELAKILLWGNGLKVPNLFYFLSLVLKPKPRVEILWQPITLTPQIQANEAIVEEINNNIVDFGIVVSGAYNFVANVTELETVNLLPLEQRSEAGHKIFFGVINKLSLLNIAFSLVIVFLLAYFSLQVNFEFVKLSKETQNFEKLIYGERYFQIKKDIESFNAEIDYLYTLTGKIRPLPAQTTSLLADYQGVTVEKLAYRREDNTLRLAGKAQNRQILLNFKNQLQNQLPDAKVESPLANFDANADISFSLKINLP